VDIDPTTGLAAGVSFVDAATRRTHRACARAVVLCASTIETVRILLNSVSAAHPRGLGNSSGLLGRFLMDHVLAGLAGHVHATSSLPPPVDDGADPYDFARPVGFYIPRFHNMRSRDAPFLRGYGVLGGIAREGDTWFMLAHGEMLARSENRVALDPARTDAWGIPVAHITCAPSENDLAMARDQIAVMHELAAAAGLEVRWPPARGPLERLAFRLWKPKLLAPSGAFVPGTAVHEIGGARMGSDRATSVLDPFNRCWDAKNVLVTDGAAFPTGCSQNVTLTIMALTVRACDHLVREYRAGRLCRGNDAT
jgi:choline dehydrogenase-like flavoprotein